MPSRIDSKGLTVKQAKFIGEFLRTADVAAAAIAAGYSPNSACKAGTRLLETPVIKAAIEEAQARRADRVAISTDDVLRELLRLATSDVSQAFDEGGKLIPLHKLPLDVRRAIASVEIRQDDDGARITKLRWWDKTKGLELLGRHLKLFVDRVEHSVDDTLAELLTLARDKVAAEKEGAE